MQAKGFLVGMCSVLSLVLILLAGCAKPPTEKITVIQTALSECEMMGAAEFAPSELQSINQKMAVLDSLMGAKKYGKATALADSISTDLTGLKSAVETNGKQAAQQVLAAANEQMAALKAMLTEENAALLDAEAAKYQQQCADGESRIAALQGVLDGGNALEVYNSSAVAGELAAAVQACSAEIAAAAEKAAKKPGKKRK